MRKETEMPDREDLEKRLWRTMPWDAAVMVPTPEQDAEEDEQEGERCGKQDKGGIQ